MKRKIFTKKIMTLFLSLVMILSITGQVSFVFANENNLQQSKQYLSELENVDNIDMLKVSKMKPNNDKDSIISGEEKVLKVSDINYKQIKNIYLDGKSGNDNNDGMTENSAVKSFAKAKELATINNIIRNIFVLETTSVEGDISLSGTNAKLIRGEDFNGYLLSVSSGKTANLSNIIIDGNSDKNTNIDKSIIDVNSNAILNIGNGTILRNNKIKDIKDTATKGGAINAYSSVINMTGGIIEENQATYGGGIYLHKSIMNFSSGIVQGNSSKRVIDTSTYPRQYYSAGGGIIANEGSTINMDGDAKVLNNSSSEIGGGISLGSNQWGATNILKMNGGTVDGNIAGSSGGGIFVQAKYFSGGESKAYIFGGNITNNKMDGSGVTDKYFGGGGIYVNGAKKEYGGNGELYLKNVLITDNTSEYEGAGYAACPISKTKIYVKDGAAIYGNNTEKGAKDIYVLCNYFFGIHSGSPEYELSKRMLGGTLYNWKDDKGELLSYDKYKGKLEKNNEELRLHTDSVGNDLTKKLTKVVISGNYSSTRGGGIGSNGNVTIGTESKTIVVSVTKKWEDNNNANKIRPESIIVQLVANIEDVQYIIEERTLNEKNNWKTTFSDLPINFNGKKINYTVIEKKVEGYTEKIDGNMKDGFVIKNKPEKPWTPMETPIRKVKVRKDWKNANGEYIKASVDKIEVELYKDGKATGNKIELNDSNKWSGEFNNLEVAEKLGSTNYYKYTVKEVGEKGNLINFDGKWFNVSYDGNMKDGYIIINKYEEPKKPKPNKPKEPEKPSKNNPETGDIQNSFLYCTLLGFSGLGLILLGSKRRKNYKK